MSREKDDPVTAAQGTSPTVSLDAAPAGLIARCAQGDQRALAELYDATAAQVNGLALRILADREVAEEVTGDVYLQVWRSAASYDPARGSALAWLFTLARSRAIDRLRAGAGERRHAAPAEPPREPESDAPGPEEGSSLAQRRRIVHAALERLGEEQRRVLEMAFFQGLSHGEIAAALGTPLGTVKTRIRLGVGRLRELLKAQGGLAS
ncbi:MAG: sigma-70 family RNA polymerase sigma factor [Thermodesulfobacteriota bacterium]